MAFVRFMASSTGRALRIVAGVALIGVGLLLVGGTTGYVIAAVGLIPLLAGLFDVCLLAALFGQPLSGRAIREAAGG